MVLFCKTEMLLLFGVGQQRTWTEKWADLGITEDYKIHKHCYNKDLGYESEGLLGMTPRSLI